MIVVATGVKNHSEFLQVVEKRFSSVSPSNQVPFLRNKAQYQGGEFKQPTESPNIKFDLAFESVPWEHDDCTAFYVMNTLFGSATSFSSGGPGKGMYCRAITNLM